MDENLENTNQKNESEKDIQSLEDEYITISINKPVEEVMPKLNEKKDDQERKTRGKRRTSRITNIGKEKKSDRKKKKLTKKQKIIILLSILLSIVVFIGIVFGVYIFKAGGSITKAALNMATDIVGTDEPIFALILGVSEDISTELTDTIILCGYNPKTQKAFMLSVPRDTFVGKNEATANGFDKINAQYQTSAERTVEAVEILTGVKIDYYAVVRNISITSIFEIIGEIDFDVPINMDYDDPTQDLHIHLKKGLQTLQPNQVEQLLRFRHNNNGTSYPSEYGDNDYGRMKTQREFLKIVFDDLISIQNIAKLKDIASMLYTNLQTNMSGYKVLEYVPSALQFSTSNLRSEQLPGVSALINELWFYKASSAGTRELMDELIAGLEMTDEQVAKYYTPRSPKSSTSSSNVTNKNNKAEKEKAHEHDYEVLSDTATCTSDGVQTLICSECSNKTTKSVSAKGHSYDSNGRCVRCGDVKKSAQKQEPSKPQTNVINNTIYTEQAQDSTNNSSNNKPNTQENHTQSGSNTTPESPKPENENKPTPPVEPTSPEPSTDSEDFSKDVVDNQTEEQQQTTPENNN